MLLAVFGDIDGNFLVLDGILRAIAEQGIEWIAHTGNCIGNTNYNRDIVLLLQESGLLWVQGTRDRLAAQIERKAALLRKEMDAAAFSALQRAHASLSSADIETLRRLPAQRQIEVDGVRVLICHGAPSGQRDRVDVGTPPVRLQRQREIAPVDIIVCGGGEEPFERLVDGTLFAGPGRADLGGGRAAYSVISTEETPWRAHHHEILCSKKSSQ